MFSSVHKLAFAGLLLACVTACNVSSVGKQSQPQPTAVIATIGQPFTTNGSVLSTTVRAGADVVLTGKNSFKGANDTGVPIIKFNWLRTDTGTDPVQLVTRTSNTVSFTAPQVAAVTTLKFQLTVTDSDGQSSSAEADVTVLPVRDANHFLTYIETVDSVVINAATSAAIPPAAAAYNVTVPFTITVAKLVQFTDNNGKVATVQVQTPATYSGGWSAAYGSGGTDCGSVRNPGIKVPIPTVNIDDLITDNNSPYNGLHLSDVMQPSDVDPDPAASSIQPAVAYAQISIQFDNVAAGDTLHVAPPAGLQPLVCLNGAGTATAGLTPSSEQMFHSANEGALFQGSPSPNYPPRDNAATAAAYYHTIDPAGAKTDLSSWLTANGFVASALDYGAAAKPGSIYHATYTNNYDLGFGRDMYVSVGPCDAGFAGVPLAQQIGHCDVASIVMNYGSVEGAIKKINPIVAVAMEYTGTASQPTQRFVKFYSFAPDARTGKFVRVTSVDLDHRGQKYMPSSCVVCHGGQPNQLRDVDVVNGIYPATPRIATSPRENSGVPGDVDAAFLPWDLDSFLYADTDPGFSNKPQDAAYKGQFSRASQEAQFKLLNSATYLTTARPTNGAEQFRYAALRELLEGWYAQGGSGVGLPGSFNGAFVPPGWSESNNGNPATTATATGSATIYKDVFMRNCRTCHVVQAPADDANPIDPAQCLANANSPPVVGRNANQYPMGCYYQFVQTSGLATYLNQGQMPFTRRTMDRLWADPAGGPTRGQELLDHLTGYFNSANAVTTGTGAPFAVAAPGTPAGLTIGDIGPLSLTGCGANPAPATCNDQARSLFVFLSNNTFGGLAIGDLFLNPQWVLCADDGSGNCASATRYPVIGTGVTTTNFLLPLPPSLPGPLNLRVELDVAGQPAVSQTVTATFN